jgi:hypothetical protein
MRDFRLLRIVRTAAPHRLSGLNGVGTGPHTLLVTLRNQERGGTLTEPRGAAKSDATSSRGRPRRVTHLIYLMQHAVVAQQSTSS